MQPVHLFRSFLLLLALAHFSFAADAPPVRTIRVPDNGVQPQSATDDKGVVHLIYLKGDPGHSDILYVRSTDGGTTFSCPIRVNSQEGAAIAIGTVRGAHMALGRDHRVHVAWMGSTSAEPKGPGKSTPMLYTRSRDDGSAFEPQRNLIQIQSGLDGGGSVAADDRGNVYVAWHAPLVKGEGEKSRRVWLSRSSDDGKTFAPEQAISSDAGACGCCGLRLFAAGGSVFTLYRGADGKLERDMTLVRVDGAVASHSAQIVGKMQSPTCVMSTSALSADAHGGAIGAWESNGNIYFSEIPHNESPLTAAAVPGRAGGRKHPALAANAAGQVLVVWTEGAGWNRGGTIAWQVYDAAGKPLTPDVGRAASLPAWGAPTAFARPDGSFVIVY